MANGVTHPRITGIWIEQGPDGKRAIRVDFDNDRHYRAEIVSPGRHGIAGALTWLANTIASDPHLLPKAVPRRHLKSV